MAQQRKSSFERIFPNGVWGPSPRWLYWQAAFIAIAPWPLLLATPNHLRQPVGHPPIGYVVSGVVVIGAALALAIVFLRREHRSTRIQVSSAASLVVFFLGAFSYVYNLISVVNRSAFNQQVGKLDALYFSLTVFTTTGFGDIAPHSTGARIAVSCEMVLTITIFGALLTAAIQRLRATNHSS